MNTRLFDDDHDDLISEPSPSHSYKSEKSYLSKKRKLLPDIELPHNVKKILTRKVLSTKECLLMGEKENKEIFKKINYKQQQQLQEIANNINNNNNKDNKDSKDSVINKDSNIIKINNDISKNETKYDALRDACIEIAEISADLELFEMERRKRSMMLLIEKMAENLDNNCITADELTDILFFGEIIKENI